MIRADLHIHTKYSFDSSINPKTLVDQLYAHEYIKAIAVTDHGSVEGCRRVSELARVYTDVLVIPGVEVGTPEGDLVVLGKAELPPKPWGIREVIDFGRENGCLTVVPHPYREYGLGSLAKKFSFDAIEVLNGCSSTQINKLAENLARETGLPGIAGSDAHHASELWTVYTEIQASLDIDEVLKAIRKGLVKVSSTGKSIRF